LQASDLVIAATNQWDDYNEAKNLRAYNTLWIEVTLKSGRLSSHHLDDAFRGTFENKSGADVGSVSWTLKLQPHQKTYAFILWPLRYQGPVPDNCDCFNLVKFDDFYINHETLALRLIKRGDFAAADVQYNEFNQLFDSDSISDEYEPEGKSAAFFRHAFLREMLQSAADFRETNAWANLQEAEKNGRFTLVDKWSLALVLNNEGKQDFASLCRLLEATSLWWNYAVAQCVKSRDGLYGDDQAFKTPANAKNFRDAFEQIQRCFRQPNVLAVIDDDVASTLNFRVSNKTKDQLSLWQQWKASSASDIGKFKLDDVGDLISGLYYIYNPKSGRNWDNRTAELN